MKAKKTTLQELREQGIAIFDNSMLRVGLSCPREYYYRHILGLTRKDIPKESKYALNFGKAGHKGLEVWEKSGRRDGEGLDAFKHSFEGLEEPPSVSHKTGRHLTATYTILFGCSLLEAYFDRYRDDERELVDVEIPVAEEIIPGYYMCGRIDKLMRRKDGKLVFADYKTTKYPQNQLISPNPQFTNYKWLIEKLTGETCEGELDILAISKTKQPDELLTRMPFSYAAFQVEQWRRSVVKHIRTLEYYRDNAESFMDWPQGWGCKGMRGECMFLPLCSLNDEDSHGPLVESMYMVEFWDPFEDLD